MATTTAQQIPIHRQVIYSVALVVLFLLAAECGLRIYAYYFRTSYERFNYHTGRLELVPGLSYRTEKGHEFRINSKGFVGPEFNDQPPSGVARIISLGDSCTFTLGLWEIAYPAVAQHIMNARKDRQSVEFINAGIEGYNSDYALTRLKDEIMRYDPRLVTLYIGWNDLMKVDPAHLSATGQYTILARFIEHSYLMKALKKVIFINLRPFLVTPIVEANREDTHAYDLFVPRGYQENLEGMIAFLQKRNIGVVVFSLPTAVERGMSQEDIRKRGIFFPYFAGTYSVDKFLSLHASYNRAIRQVTEKFGVPLVDLDKAFDNRNKEELFWDTMHPNQAGNRVIAGVLADRLQQLGF